MWASVFQTSQLMLFEWSYMTCLVKMMGLDSFSFASLLRNNPFQFVAKIWHIILTSSAIIIVVPWTCVYPHPQQLYTMSHVYRQPSHTNVEMSVLYHTMHILQVGRSNSAIYSRSAKIALAIALSIRSPHVCKIKLDCNFKWGHLFKEATALSKNPNTAHNRPTWLLSHLALAYWIWCKAI